MLSFEGVLEGVDDHILYKKKQIKDGRFLYSYKDAGKAAKEEYAYPADAEKKGTFSPEKYAEKKNRFGVIVLESDQDMEPRNAYLCYDDRWMHELVFNRYKSDECLDHTDVQGDFSVIGSKFVNFLATAATCQIVRKATQTGLLSKMTYSELMDDLSSTWRKTDAPSEASADDGYWVHTLLMVHEELEVLGLSKPAPEPEPKKLGRIPKPKDLTSQEPKRPRGRPPKKQNSSADIL